MRGEHDSEYSLNYISKQALVALQQQPQPLPSYMALYPRVCPLPPD